MIPAINAFNSASFSQSMTGTQSVTDIQARSATALDTKFGKIADALILSALLDDSKDGKERMQLGELLMIGQALSEASKINLQLDALFSGISQLTGLSPVQPS